MRSDPHDNIFYYYRGSTRVDGEPAIFDRQIENNTTKALINLLRYDKAGHILRVFLAEVERRSNGARLHVAHPETSLQRAPSSSVEMRTRIVLCLEPNSHQTVGDAPGGRPDAYIIDRTESWVVAVEAKLYGKVSLTQIQGHARQLGWDNFKCVRLTWSEIYELVAGMQHGDIPQASQFLRDQWLRYMEMIGMAPFKGFSSDDLDFFIHRDEVLRRPILKKLETFASLVRDRLPSELKGKYRNLQPGTLFAHKPAWIALQRTDLPKSFLQCNFTLEINLDGVCAHAVIRNGRHNSPDRPIKTFYDYVRSKPMDFLKLLRSLGKDHYMRISSRTNGRGGRPLPGADFWNPVCTLALGTVTDRTPEFVADMLKTIDFPGIHVGTQWPRGHAMIGKADELVPDAAKTLSGLSGILDIVHAAN